MEPADDLGPVAGARRRPPVRPRRNVVIAAVLLGALLLGRGTSSSATDVQHRLRLVTEDPQPDVAPVATTAPAPAPTLASVPGSSSTTTMPVVATVPPLTDETTWTTVEVATDDPPVVPVSSPATNDPALVSRPIPAEVPPPAVPVVSPYADASTSTAAGYVATTLGCASGTSAGALDAFFRDRMGPVIGHDYQHVYPLGGGRYLWLFQDTFVDYSGAATSLGQAAFMHNTAMVQDDACFTLYHRGTTAAPASFEPGNGEQRLAKWFWPMGGELVGGHLVVFWAEMQKDGYEPSSPNGLGWHPVRTWTATYDARTLARLAFAPAPNSGVAPIYGYAVASDAEYTYLFGNTFEQNLQREGGYFNGPHSGTVMWLARVPLGRLDAAPEYRTADDWSADPSLAEPIAQRYWAENPMQPRYLAGQWVAVTKVNGYWGDSLAVDVANDPWGPWTTVESRGLSPRGGDPLMNTYHAYLMPWLDGGSLVVSVSQNARNMARDAWPVPARYRLAFFSSTLVVPPPRDDPTTTTSSIDETSTTVPESSTSSTDVATTTSAPTTTSTSTTATTSTTTTIVPVTTTSTSTTLAPPVTEPVDPAGSTSTSTTSTLSTG